MYFGVHVWITNEIRLRKITQKVLSVFAINPQPNISIDSITMTFWSYKCTRNGCLYCKLALDLYIATLNNIKDKSFDIGTKKTIHSVLNKAVIKRNIYFFYKHIKLLKLCFSWYSYSRPNLDNLNSVLICYTSSSNT